MVVHLCPQVRVLMRYMETFVAGGRTWLGARFPGIPTHRRDRRSRRHWALQPLPGRIKYSSPGTGAHEVHGDIRGRWAELGWERGFLGYPLTDETGAPDGIGRYNHFQGGSICWSPDTGAHEVHGDIRGRWAELGWERSFLGYPITDEHDCPPGRCSDFQNGTISWTPQGGSQDKPQTFVVDAPDITFGTGIAAGGHRRSSLQATVLSRSGGVCMIVAFLPTTSLRCSPSKIVPGRRHTPLAIQAGYTVLMNGESRWRLEWTTNNDLVRQLGSIRAGAGGWKVDVTSDWSPQKIAEDVLSVVGTAVGIVALFV